MVALSQKVRVVADIGLGSVVTSLLVLGTASQTQATKLTFDQIRQADEIIPTISGRAVPQDYGDRVTGSPMDVTGGQFTYGNGGEGFTPNVVVDYFTGSSTPNAPGVSLWTELYGDLENVAFGNQNSNFLAIQLTADPTFTIQLYSFDLAGWPSADYEISAVRVLEGNNSLFSLDNVLIEGNSSGPQHTSFDFATPLSGSQLLIEIDYSNLNSSQHDNIGIDNIRFGQTPPPISEPAPVPEPSNLLGLVLGLAYLSMTATHTSGLPKRNP